jgi:hypothetical protein
MKEIQTQKPSTIRKCKTVVRTIITKYTFVFLFLPVLFIAYPLFGFGPGVSTGGDFPFADTGDYAVDKLWLWVEKGSYANFEVISRFPIIALWYILNFFALDSAVISRIMIVFGFLASSFSFYFAFIFLFKNKLQSRSENNGGYLFNDGMRLRLAAILGSLFYAYNVWSFHRISHWYLWIGYAVLPIFFCSIFYAFKYPRNWKYIISSVLLWSLASTTPHMTIFYGIIFIFCFALFLLKGLLRNQNKKKKLELLLPLFSIVIIYALLNLYWIYPYVLAQQTRSVSPDYLLVIEGLETLSRDSNFLNTFRIVTDWSTGQPSENSSYYALWFSATFIVPVFAFSTTLFVKRSLRKYTLTFSLIAVLGIVLAMGTKSPINYFQLLLVTPVIENYVWIFRDPDKWSFAIAFSYSFLIGIGSYRIFEILGHSSSKRVSKNVVMVSFFLLLLVGSIYISSIPVYANTMLNELKPVRFPNEFDRLNEYFTNTKTDKIFFMPYPAVETTWHKSGRVGGIYQIHSQVPSIESAGPATRNYYNFFVDSIIENRSKNIGNLIYPLGTSHFIFHNDTWNIGNGSIDYVNLELLRKLNELEGFENQANIGFFSIFNAKEDIPNNLEFNIPKHTIAATGGLDMLASLNTIPSYDSLNSSVIFLNDALSDNAGAFDTIATKGSDSNLDLAFSFLKPEHVVGISTFTNNHDPMHMWSKSSSLDPVNRFYHPYLERFGFDSWAFDYGKGIAMTQRTGANLSFPIQSTEDAQYQGFLRYLENQRGGILRIYLDGKILGDINSLSDSNKYAWNKLFDTSNSSLNISKGKHILTIENLSGFNSVNVLALVPQSEIERINNLASNLLNSTDIFYILEAESDFNLTPQASNISDYSIPFFELNDTGPDGIGAEKTFSWQFKTPRNNDLYSFIVAVNDNSNSTNSYTFKNLELSSDDNSSKLLELDFEDKGGFVPLAVLRQSQFQGHHDDFLSIYPEQGKPLSGNSSLGITIPKSGKVTDWATVSTDFIPIYDNSYYNFSMDISTKDIRQLHVKSLFYDTNEKRIGQEIVYNGRDGTFADSVSSSLIPPKGAKFMRVEILAGQNTKGDSSYIVDNVLIQEIPHNNNLMVESKNGLSMSSALRRGPGFPELSGITEREDGNSNVSKYEFIRTKPIPVKENSRYNLILTTEANGMSHPSALAYIGSSQNAKEDAIRSDVNASGGKTVSLDKDSQIYTNIEVLKASNYTLALRAKSCSDCKFITINVLGNEASPSGGPYYGLKKYNVSSSENEPLGNNTFDWFQIKDIFLEPGKYEIRINTDSEVDLDSAVIFSSGLSRSGLNRLDSDLGITDTFGAGSQSPPAYITKYDKINPTKHTVSISNATRPYTLSFAESYDPLWRATISSEENSDNHEGRDTIYTKSIPLYSIVNGFPINMTGNYKITVEYLPQIWFWQASLISFPTLIIIVGILFQDFIRRNYLVYLDRLRAFMKSSQHTNDQV